MSNTIQAGVVVLVIAASLAPGRASAASNVIDFRPGEQTRHPSLTADGSGHLHLAFLAREKDKQVDDVFHAVSKDGGRTWGAITDVSRTPGESKDPVIAGRENVLVIAWVDTTASAAHPGVWVAVSADAGATWTKAADVSKTLGVSSAPSVAVASDGTIHVVWVETRGGDHGDIRHSQSSDHGATWRRSQNLSKTPGASTHPAVACGPDGEVYVAWADTMNAPKENPDIWFVASKDGGKTWSKRLDVSETPAASSTPDIAVADDGSIMLAWVDTASNLAAPDIFVATSRNGGVSFEKPINVSETPGASSEPAIAAGQGAVVVVWRDKADNPNDPDIWLSDSTDGAKTFASAKDISRTGGDSDVPRVALAPHIAIVAWEEKEKTAFHIRLVPVELPGARGDSALQK